MDPLQNTTAHRYHTRYIIVGLIHDWLISISENQSWTLYHELWFTAALYFETDRNNSSVSGALGDCWLLSSLSVLADRPDLIERVFLNKSVCTEGKWYTYVVYRLPSNNQLQQQVAWAIFAGKTGFRFIWFNNNYILTLESPNNRRVPSEVV